MGQNISVASRKPFKKKEEPLIYSRQLADYTPSSFLGSGSFGAVFKCYQRVSTDCVAVKVMKGDMLGAISSKWKRESSILQELEGEPFVLQLLESFLDARNLYCIVTEFASPVTLGGLVLRSRRLDEGAVRFYLAELAIALGVLQKKHIVHLDLKVDNILLDREGHVVLADFGEARMLSALTRASISVKIFLPFNSAGHLPWKEISHPQVTDWRSYAVTANYIATRGQYIFGPSIRDGQGGPGSFPRRTFDDGLSATFRDLLRRLVTKDRKDSLGPGGVEEIMEHPFFETIDWTLATSRRLLPPASPGDFERFNIEEKVSDWTTDCLSRVN